MWPLNIRSFPRPIPSRRPTTFGRFSSTCCQVTESPMSLNVCCMYLPISCSLPVGLEMSITSLDISTIDSSSTADTIRSSKPDSIDSVLLRVASLIIRIHFAHLGQCSLRGDRLPEETILMVSVTRERVPWFVTVGRRFSRFRSEGPDQQRSAKRTDSPYRNSFRNREVRGAETQPDFDRLSFPVP